MKKIQPAASLARAGQPMNPREWPAVPAWQQSPFFRDVLAAAIALTFHCFVPVLGGRWLQRREIQMFSSTAISDAPWSIERKDLVPARQPFTVDGLVRRRHRSELPIDSQRFQLLDWHVQPQMPNALPRADSDHSLGLNESK